MDNNNIPDMVIAEICSYLSFEDVQSLMKTNRKTYYAIKSYNLDKIKLKSLWLDSLYLNMPFYSTRATGKDLSGKTYKVANFKVNEGEENANIKQVLDQVYSIDELDVCRKVFSMELFNYLMAAKIKIKVFSMSVNDIDISTNDVVKFCRRFPLVNIKTGCGLHTPDPAIWSDEVLTAVLPSTICKPKSGTIIGGVDAPMPITDRTLEAVTKWMPVTFSLYRIHTCITIEGIVKAIQTLLDKKKTEVRWQLGCLNRSQQAVAERFLQKEAGRGFYFTRQSGSYCEHEYKVIDSANDRCFMGFHTGRDYDL